MAADPRVLYDAADAASAGRRTAWWPGPPVLWLTSPAVQVGGKTWRARHHGQRDGGEVHGYTPRQCDQIRRALLPVLAEMAAPLEDQTRRFC
jgi:hypothetical protein